MLGGRPQSAPNQYNFSAGWWQCCSEFGLVSFHSLSAAGEISNQNGDRSQWNISTNNQTTIQLFFQLLFFGNSWIWIGWKWKIEIIQLEEIGNNW